MGVTTTVNDYLSEEEIKKHCIRFVKRYRIIMNFPREGVIIECHLNGQYHDHRDVILTSRMAVSNNFITATVIQNIGNSSF